MLLFDSFLEALDFWYDCKKVLAPLFLQCSQEKNQKIDSSFAGQYSDTPWMMNGGFSIANY